MPTRILLADDHGILREGLRALLQKQPDFEVVAEADDGRAAVKLAKELQPDVVIIDIAMPNLNGIEATRKILADLPETKVLALSMHSDKRFVTGILREGASGYLLKDSAFEELSLAIQTVCGGRKYLSPGIAGIVVEDVIQQAPQSGAPRPTLLTHREREVLQLLAEGKATKEIAPQLNVSVKTIETHRKNIMDKLKIRNIAELTKYAIREGLTSLDQ